MESDAERYLALKQYALLVVLPVEFLTGLEKLRKEGEKYFLPRLVEQAVGEYLEGRGINPQKAHEEWRRIRAEAWRVLFPDL